MQRTSMEMEHAFSQSSCGATASGSSLDEFGESPLRRRSVEKRESTARRSSGEDFGVRRGSWEDSGARRRSDSGRRRSSSGRRDSQGRRYSSLTERRDSTPKPTPEEEQIQQAVMAAHDQQKRRTSIERGRRQDIVTYGYEERMNAAGSNSNSPKNSRPVTKSESKSGGQRKKSDFDISESSMAAAGSGDTNMADIATSAASAAEEISRRISQVYQLDGLPQDDNFPAGLASPSRQIGPGSPQHAWAMSGTTSPMASGMQSPTSPTEGAGHTNRSMGIFSHKGVWVRPASIGESLGPLHSQDRFPDLEEHAGYIDASAGIDVAHAILAFEFIDRINDEVLTHYLPFIDESMGKELGLRHERGRLRTPDPNAGDASADSMRSSPVLEGSETSGGGSQSTAYYDAGERVSGSGGYEAASCGGSVAGDPHGDVDSRRSRQESWTSDSRAGLEGLSPEDRDFTADSWDAECSAASQQQVVAPEHIATEPLADSAHLDDYSLGSRSEATPEALEQPQASALSPDVVDEPRAESLSATPDFLPYQRASALLDEDIEGNDVLQSDGPSSASHGTGFLDKQQGSYWVGSNSAEAQVWPHACSVLPKSSSQTRSGKLKAVDSIPDPLPANMFDISTSSAGGGTSGARDTLPLNSMSSLIPGSGAIVQTVGSSYSVGRSTFVAGVPVILPDLNVPKATAAKCLPLSHLCLPSDPAVAAAPAAAVYGAGACRVRRPGEQPQLERARVRSQKRAERNARACARGRTRENAMERSSRMAVGGNSGMSMASTAKREPNLNDSGANVMAATGSTSSASVTVAGPSAPPTSSRDAAGHRSTAGAGAGMAGDARGGLADGLSGSGLVSTAGMTGQMSTSGQLMSLGSGRHLQGMSHGNTLGSSLPVADEEQPWPPRRPSPTCDQFEDLLTLHLRGDVNVPGSQSSPAERRQRRANSTCPFSHDHMDSSSAVDLRCGHRFALARLGVARRAARLCCSAGFAMEDALICPLCGDMDVTSKPGASKMLKTYSTNTDAYLGDLRKDWRRPLHLPMQTEATGELPVGVELNTARGDMKALEVSTPTQGELAAPMSLATGASTPMPVTKPASSAPGSARPSGRHKIAALQSLKANISSHSINASLS